MSYSIPLIQTQLDHTSSSSPSLVLIQDSIQLSASLLLREFLIRSSQRNHQSLLCTTLRDPRVYLPPQGKRDGLQALDAHSCTQGYEDDDEEEEPTDDQTVDGIVKVESMKELAFRIRERIRRAGSSTHLTIVIDSLDSLLEQYDYSSTRSYDQVHELIRSILKGLNPHSRLIILHPLDSRNTEAKTLFSSLLSPLIFSSSKPSNNSSMEDSAKPSTGSGQTSILRLHSPALPRILLKEYGLLPPTTSEKLLESIRNEREARSREEAKKLEAGNRIQRGAGDHDKKKSSNRIKSSESSSDADPRFWEVLNNVASRGELLFSTSNSKTGDFEIEEAFSHQAASTSNSRSSSSSLIDSSSALSSITLDRLKPASRVDGDSSSHSKWAMIETRNRSRNGKWAEEVLGLVRSQDENQGGTLSVVGLDMRQTETKRGKLPWEEEEVEGSSKNVNSQQISTKTAEKSNTKPTSSQQEQDPHAKLVGNLPFNLSETSSQRAKRDDVPLPYTFYKQQENQSSNEPIQKGKILFEPESEDDEDEEDPDDDLDI